MNPFDMFKEASKLAEFWPKIEALIFDVLRDFPAIRDAVKKLIADVEADLNKPA